MAESFDGGGDSASHYPPVQFDLSGFTLIQLQKYWQFSSMTANAQRLVPKS